jgi:hypothetical protein
MDKFLTIDHILALIALAFLYIIGRGIERIHDELTEFHKDYVERTGGDRFE